MLSKQLKVLSKMLTRNASSKNKCRHDATIRQLEIVGEAAKNLSEDLRQENPQVAWKEAYRTRDRLAHGYFQLNLKIIWDITQNDLPILKKHIEKILEEELKK